MPSSKKLSVYRSFIVLTCLLIFSFLFSYTGGVSVMAQVPTPSVTNTLIPPTVTSTPFNLLCPIGTPYGYGTYTPSPLWLLECGHCEGYVGTPTATFTPSPFPTWDGTGTPSPTVTVTSSPTVTPTSLPSLITFDEGYAETTASPYIEVNPLINSCFSVGGLYKCEGTVSGSDYNFFSGVAGAILTFNSGYDVDTQLYFYWDMTVTNGLLLDPFALFHGTWDYVYSDNSSYSSLYPEYAEFTLQLKYSTGSDWTGGFSFDYELYISASPIVSTPTPVVTPTLNPLLPHSYCASLAPPEVDFGFDLFVEDGEANCDFGWDEFGVGEYTMPAVQTCLQPVQVGVVRLFGTDYEMGLIFLAVAVAFIYRYARTV